MKGIVKLEYEGKTYDVPQTFVDCNDNDHTREVAIFYWEEGNMCSDWNRASMIYHYSDPTFVILEKFESSYEYIKLISITFEDGEVRNSHECDGE